MARNTLTHCGYLYNWYGATGGTGLASMDTDGDQATGNICPANFRLPSSRSAVGNPTGNGISISSADLPVLNASMKAESLATGAITNDSTTYPNWQPNGAWSGTFSGYWLTSMFAVGSSGWFWSSSVLSVTNANSLFFLSTSVNPGGSAYNMSNGFTVRCILP